MASEQPTPTSKRTKARDTGSHLRVLRQFRLVFSSVRKHYRDMEKRAGLGGASVWALSLIAKQPGIRVTELAQSMDVHQSTASNLVKGLLKAGLVTSEKSAIDKRVAELHPLAEGEKLLKKVAGPYTGVLPQALSKLDDKTLAQLERHLEALLQKLNVDERSAQTPMALM